MQNNKGKELVYFDYYPFGMLMPGRYVSDTSERCMTISRTGWSTILVDSCKPLGVLYANNFSSGGATAAYANNNLILSVPAGGSIGFAMEVAAGVDNTFEFNVGNIKGASEQGVLVTVLETIDNVQYVIGGGRLLPGRQKVNFRSVANSVSLVFPEHFTEMELAMICTKYPKSVQHTYLVDVCDESKDRYRFGFNGQEKVNEIAGVGNHNTALFWEYDTRLGRRWNRDPVDQISVSNYAAFADNPIANSDALGNVVKFGTTQYYTNKAGENAARTLKKSEIEGIKREWSRAMDLLRANGFGDLADYIESDKITITLSSAVDVQKSAILVNNELKFNFRGGLRTTSGKKLSPITVLVHELDHLIHANEYPEEHKRLQNIKVNTDPSVEKYYNLEEKRVITGLEQKAAIQFKDIKVGEVTRIDHDGEMFETNDVNSNKERNTGGYTHLGIEGYEVKTQYDPNKGKSSSPNQTSDDSKSFLIMGPDSKVK